MERLWTQITPRSEAFSEDKWHNFNLLGDADVKSSFEEYIQHLDLSQLFETLGAANPETLAKTVEHFTIKEAEKRDKIVSGYFGEDGVQRIVEAVTEQLQTPKLRKGSKVLDVGAGSGFFTAKISERIPQAKFYAMDATPAKGLNNFMEFVCAVLFSFIAFTSVFVLFYGCCFYPFGYDESLFGECFDDGFGFFSCWFFGFHLWGSSV